MSYGYQTRVALIFAPACNHLTIISKVHRSIVSNAEAGRQAGRQAGHIILKQRDTRLKDVTGL